jgi:LysM repeat protein
MFADEKRVYTTPAGENVTLGTMGTVEKNDTYENLAEKYYGDSTLASIIMTANGIDPDKPEIKPGQVLFIPALGEKSVDKKGNVSYSFASFYDPKNPEASKRYMEGLYKTAGTDGVWIRSNKDGAQTDVITPIIGVFTLQFAMGGTAIGLAYEAASDALLKITISASLWGQKALDKLGSLFGRTPASQSYNPMNPGPLPEGIANTFRSSTYTAEVTQKPTILYRVWGGKAGETGIFWSKTPPAGALQTTIDSAILPEWGNTMANVTKICVPPGVTIYQGAAAAQGALVGGGNQVVILQEISKSWIVH